MKPPESKLVPLDPTTEQLIAGVFAYAHERDLSEKIRATYRAMIAKAPTKRKKSEYVSVGWAVRDRDRNFVEGPMTCTAAIQSVARLNDWFQRHGGPYKAVELFVKVEGEQK